MLKKILSVGLLSIVLGTMTIVTPVNAQEDVGFGDNSLIDGYHVPGTDTSNNDDTLLNVIKKAVNWVLGILSLIALILCLYGGFQMLTAAGDDNKVKTGKKVLINAAIGLAVIGLSWLLVSFIFRIIDKFTTGV